MRTWLKVIGDKVIVATWADFRNFHFFSFLLGGGGQVVLYRFNRGFPPPSLLKINNISVNSALYATCNLATVFDFPDWLVINELITVMAVAPT